LSLGTGSLERIARKSDRGQKTTVPLVMYPG
jgi:hypothetical protein